MNKNFIQSLNESNVHEYAKSFVNLDNLLFKKTHFDYADEPWTEENFTSNFLCKWQCSYAALDLEKKCVTGFLIVTQQLPEEIHIHRLAVDLNYRRKGIAQQLLKKLDEFAQENHLKRITLEVSISNKEGVCFYKKCGYELLSREELKEYMHLRKTDEECIGDVIRDHVGYESYILNKRFNE